MITFINTDDVLRYETFEYNLTGADSNKNVLICPWHTLYIRNLLDTIPNIAYDYTICKFHLVGTPIQTKIEQMGITKVLTPHASIHDNCQFQTIPYFHYVGEAVELKKDVHYSFMGWSNVNMLREKMMELLSGNTNIIGNAYGFWSKGNNTDPNLESRYNTLLGRSRFSLCPKGAGPATMRFWESLKCGSIPILMSDSVILPLDWDWSSTIIRLPEKSLYAEKNAMERAVFSVKPSDEVKMKANCKAAYNKTKPHKYNQANKT